jgi:hypothetical protein
MKVHRFARLVSPTLAGLLAIGGTAVVPFACNGQPEPKPFDGSSLGYCSGSQVAEIQAEKCSDCGKGTAYALCNGTSYTECACQIPNGYSLDSGLVDGPEGEPVVGMIGFNGGGPAGVALPCCSGDEVFEIPSNECAGANCVGSVAYAVCQNNSYSACSCEIPAGYGYPDGNPCDAN